MTEETGQTPEPTPEPTSVDVSLPDLLVPPPPAEDGSA